VSGHLSKYSLPHDDPRGTGRAKKIEATGVAEEINGDALTTSASGIAQFPGEVLLIDNEDINSAARQFG
jgi:hypothetical protein